MIVDTQAAAATSLDAVRAVLDSSPALPELAPDAYARGHAGFEARSEQRRLITERLLALLAARGDGPLSVLSVGCGDGSVDVALADSLTGADPSRQVRYVGVEPFAGSAAAFAQAMTGLDRPGLAAEVHRATFDAAVLTGPFDVVTFVHSLYYVPDVPTALLAAHDLLGPGGDLVVLSAPRGALNALAGVLAPPVEGHRQWFSDDVVAGFLDAGIVPDVGCIDARVDLTEADDAVLDFTVQARLTDDLRPLVRGHLAAIAEPGDALVLPHPVDVFRATRVA